MSGTNEQAVTAKGKSKLPRLTLKEGAHSKRRSGIGTGKPKVSLKPGRKAKKKNEIPIKSPPALKQADQQKNAVIAPGVETALRSLDIGDMLVPHDPEIKASYIEFAESSPTLNKVSEYWTTKVDRAKLAKVPIGDATIIELAPLLNPCDQEKLDRVCRATYMVNALNPKMARTMVHLLSSLEKDVHVLFVEKKPLSHFCREQVRLWCRTLSARTREKKVTPIDFLDATSCLFDLALLVAEEDPETAVDVAENFSLFSVIIYEYASNLSVEGGILPLDFLTISQALSARVKAQPRKKNQIPDRELVPHLEDIKAEILIGAGGFGAVYKVRYERLQLTCTLKLVNTDSFGLVEQEISDRVVHSLLGEHKCLVNYYCVSSVKECTIIMMEYIKGVDLHKVIDANRAMTVRQSRVLFAQVISAVIYLHVMGIVHRDIKANNCLVTADGKLKVIDFDTAKVCIGHYPSRSIKTFFKLTALEFRKRERAGTLPYMAPEIISGRPFGRSSDFWSCGILLFKMTMGYTPFRGAPNGKLKAAVCSAQVPFPKKAKLPDFSIQAKDMILQLLRKHAARRLGSQSYTEVLAHPFFRQIDWDELGKSEAPLPGLEGYEKVIRKANGCFENGETVDYKCLSPRASSRTRGRQGLLKLEDIIEDPRRDEPVFNYISPYLRAIHEKTQKERPHPPEPLFPRIAQSEPCRLLEEFTNKIDEMTRAESETIEVIIFRPDKRGFLDTRALGFSTEPIHNDKGGKALLVTHILPSSPASNSLLIVGDIIVAINGKACDRISWWKMLWMRNIPREHATIFSVIVSNPFRMLRTHHEISVLSCYDILCVEFEKSIFRKNMEVRQATCYVAGLSSAAPLWLIWKGAPASGIYFGDVLLTINDTWTQAMREPEIHRLLRGSNKFKLSVVPCSCLRTDRLRFDRLLRSWDDNIKNTADPESADQGKPQIIIDPEPDEVTANVLQTRETAATPVVGDIEPTKLRSDSSQTETSLPGLHDPGSG